MSSKEAPQDHPLRPAMNRVHEKAQELLREIVGEGPTVSGEAMLRVTLMAMILPAIFRAYRNEILKDDPRAAEFHDQVEKSFTIVAWPAQGKVARNHLFIGPGEEC